MPDDPAVVARWLWGIDGQLLLLETEGVKNQWIESDHWADVEQ